MWLLLGFFFLASTILLALKFVWEIPILGKTILIGTPVLFVLCMIPTLLQPLWHKDFYKSKYQTEQVESYKPDFEKLKTSKIKWQLVSSASRNLHMLAQFFRHTSVRGVWLPINVAGLVAATMAGTQTNCDTFFEKLKTSKIKFHNEVTNKDSVGQLQVTNDLPQGKIQPYGVEATLSFDAYVVIDGKKSEPIGQFNKTEKDSLKDSFILHFKRENRKYPVEAGKWVLDYVESRCPSDTYSRRFEKMEDPDNWELKLIMLAIN